MLLPSGSLRLPTGTTGALCHTSGVNHLHISLTSSNGDLPTDFGARGRLKSVRFVTEEERGSDHILKPEQSFSRRMPTTFFWDRIDQLVSGYKEPLLPSKVPQVTTAHGAGAPVRRWTSPGRSPLPEGAAGNLPAAAAGPRPTAPDLALTTAALGAMDMSANKGFEALPERAIGMQGGGEPGGGWAWSAPSAPPAPLAATHQPQPPSAPVTAHANDMGAGPLKAKAHAVPIDSPVAPVATGSGRGAFSDSGAVRHRRGSYLTATSRPAESCPGASAAPPPSAKSGAPAAAASSKPQPILSLEKMTKCLEQRCMVAGLAPSPTLPSTTQGTL